MARGLGWQGQALCGRLDRAEAARLFLNRGKAPRAAHDMCARCPVIAECRAWGDEMENHETTTWGLSGFLAGETPGERAARRRQKEPVPC